MAPFWKILGQNIYVDCWSDQLEQMYSVKFSRLQEFCINRTVRTYPSDCDKDTMAIDE